MPNGLHRAAVVGQVMRGAPAGELSVLERQTLDRVVGWFRLDSEARPRHVLEEDHTEAVARFNARPMTTLLHVLPGALFLFLVPLQLMPRIRARHPSVHRRLGRILLVVAVPFSLTGLVLGGLGPCRAGRGDLDPSDPEGASARGRTAGCRETLTASRRSGFPITVPVLPTGLYTLRYTVRLLTLK